MTNEEKVDVLKEALPYIIAFHGKVFVIKIGGELAGDSESLDSIAGDIVFLRHVGINVVVVHGGGPQATKLAEERGIQPKIVQGLRVTDIETLNIAKMVYAGQVNTDIIASLRKHELMAPDGLHFTTRRTSGGVGLTGVDGNLIRVRKKGEVDGEDLGYVGEIEAVNPEILHDLIEKRYIPVVACLGFDEHGDVYNINADTVAAELALHMEAEKLIVLTNVPGVLKAPADADSLISYLDVEQAKAMLTTDALTGGMIPKLEACIRTVESKKVERAHILQGTKKGSLLVEVLTRGGSGTMIVTSEEAHKYKAKELSVKESP
jgi:acetylglutamate kinase